MQKKRGSDRPIRMQTRLGKRLPPGRFLPAVLAAIGLAGCGEGTPGTEGSRGPDPYALMEGEGIYRMECATCHGANREGQADWRTRKPDGKLPAPPHDASGHTWHHPMEQLVAIVKHGMAPPNAPPGYVSDMPAFGGKLKEQQIRNVLAYIESQWPPEVRAMRAERLQQQK